jgi:membrane protease subunit (stomatin/prohibitin family)
MMMRRGPGLLGTMARTAVVAGTATAVSGGIMRRQQARADQAAEAAAYQQQQEYAAAAPQPAAAANADDDLTAKLQKLADLRSAGVLSDTEFTAAKARLLG